MKNCGRRFHNEVGKFRFLNELIKVVSPKVSQCSFLISRNFLSVSPPPPPTSCYCTASISEFQNFCASQPKYDKQHGSR